jgi:hypothetical protein
MYNAILSAGLVTVSAPNTNVKGNVETTKVRYEVYPGYRIWCSDVFKAVERGLISERESIDIFVRVKETAISNYNLAVMFQQTTQVAEVVVDELALLKAELAAVKACDNAKALVIKNLERDNERLVEKVGVYQALIEGLKSRTIVVGNVITKVLVSSKVGI